MVPSIDTVTVKQKYEWVKKHKEYPWCKHNETKRNITVGIMYGMNCNINNMYT